MKKVGIFSGVFDPIHKGHIGLALQAINAAKLDEVYFMAETKPRHKEGVTHIAHRLAMLRLAIKPYPKLNILEIPDKQFSVAKTLPRLKQKLGDAHIYFICGSDMLNHMPDWELIDKMLPEQGLIVGIRAESSAKEIKVAINNLPAKPTSINIISSAEPEVSSGQIRNAISRHQKAEGLLPGTESYIREHWLYTVASESSSDS